MSTIKISDDRLLGGGGLDSAHAITSMTLVVQKSPETLIYQEFSSIRAC